MGMMTKKKPERNTKIIKHIKIKMCTDISKSQQQVISKKERKNTHKCYVLFLFGGSSREWEKNETNLYIFAISLVLYSRFFMFVYRKQATTLNFVVFFCSTFSFFSLLVVEATHITAKRKTERKKKVHGKFMSDIFRLQQNPIYKQRRGKTNIIQ